MARIDYSVPEFELLIGTFDCTEYVDSISLSVPMHEVATPLIWTGKFTLSYNRAAIRNGLSEDDFNQLITPIRWRPGQQAVQLSIDGYTLPILRIDRYAYNTQTQQAEGTLTQILGLVGSDRPGKNVELDYDTFYFSQPRTGGLTYIYYYGASLGKLIQQLIALAFASATVTPTDSTIAGDFDGLMFAPVTTRNPVGDAQKLCGINWRWLAVDNTESIVSVSGKPSDTPLFNRSLADVEWEPDLENIYFAASKFYVTGSYQAPNPFAYSADSSDVDLDSFGRVVTQQITEVRAIGAIFPESTSTTQIVSETKIIGYQYANATGIPAGILLLGLPSEILTAITSTATLVKKSASKSKNYIDPYQTITVTKQPKGRIYESLGINTDLQISSVEVQSDYWRARWVPKGKVFSDDDGVFALTLEKREDLNKSPFNYYDPRENLEESPNAEPRQPAANSALETNSVLGTAEVESAGWSPVYEFAHTVDVGFLPPTLADNLATRFAAREQYRRDAVQITMPIPTEWLAAGCPLLFRCQVFDGSFLADGLVIVIEDGEAKFSFSGGRIDQYEIDNNYQPIGNPIPLFGERIYVDIEWAPEIEITTEVLLDPATSTIDVEFVPEIAISTYAIVPDVYSTIDVEFVPEVEVTTSIAVDSTIDVEWIPEIEISSLVAVSIALDVEFIAEIEIVADIAASNTISVEFVPEIEISTAIISSGAAIEGSNSGTPFEIEGSSSGTPFTIEGN